MFTRMFSAAVLFFAPRSSSWPAARRMHLEREPCCQWCGTRDELQVHHIKCFRLHPELELEPTNFITLCMGPLECHYRQGHMGRSWLAFDPDVRAKCELHGTK